MGNTCKSMADSCQCMAKTLQYCKVISLQLMKINGKKIKKINKEKKRKEKKKARVHVPCIGRQILNHWTTREAPAPLLFCPPDYHLLPSLFILTLGSLRFDQ